MENMDMTMTFAEPSELFKTLSDDMTAAALERDPAFQSEFTAHILEHCDPAKGNSLPEWSGAKDGGVTARVVQERGCVFRVMDEAVERSGVVVSTLSRLAEQVPALKEKIEARFASVKRGLLGQILTGISPTVVYIPKNIRLDGEALMDVIASGEKFTDAAHVWLWLEDGAEATINLNLSSRNDADETLTLVSLTAIVGRNSTLRLHEIQGLNARAYSVCEKTMIVESDGSADWVTVEAGSNRSLSDLILDLAGDSASAKVNGVFFGSDEQRLTMHTRQEHHGKNTFSSLLYKGAVTDRARGVWTGMIYVDPMALGADGYQKNDNLMLSPDARVFARPGLEIVTDDVKCSHGTTVTEINKDQIFYLMSRGISEKDARSLVVEGFFDEILNDLSVETIREKVRAEIRSKFEQV